MKSNLVLLAFAAILIQSAIADPHPDPWVGEDTYHVVKEGVEDAAEAVADAAGKAWNTVEGAAVDAGKAVANTAEGAYIAVKGGVEDAAVAVADTAEKAWNTVEGAAKDAGKAVADTAEKAWDTVEGAAKDAGKAVADTAEKAWDGIQDTAKDAGKAVADTAEKAWNEIQDAAEETAKAVASTAEKAWDEVKETSELVVRKTIEFGSMAIDSIKEQTNALIGKAKNLGNSLEELTTGGVRDLTAMANDFSRDMANTINDITGDFQKKFVEESIHVLELINKTTSDLQELIPKTCDTASNGIVEQTLMKARDWENWAQKELQQVGKATNNNDTHVQKAHSILLPLLVKYSNELQSCTDEILDELDEFESLVQNIIAVYKVAVNDLRATVSDCLGEKKIEEESALRCWKRVYKSLKVLRRAPTDFLNVQASGFSLITAGLSDSGCALLVVTEFHEARNEVGALLNDIKLKFNQN